MKMASSIGRQLLRRGEYLIKNYVPPQWRSKSSDVKAICMGKNPSVRIWVATTGGILTAAVIYARKYSVFAEGKPNLQNKKAVAAGIKEDDGSTTPSKIHLTLRERRFVKFASIEFDGQLYMSPRDFLESVTENDARPRLKRQVLLPKQLDAMQRWTPPASKGSSTLFRTLGDNGIISYTEYLFLLSILTKPQSGFHIAFNMFDTDGNRQVDKDEFLVLTNVVAKFSWKESPWQDMVKHFGQNALERIFSHARLSRQNAREAKEKLNNPGKVNVEVRTNEAQVHKTLRQELDNVVVNTTLLVHFFGKKGKGVLGYEDFSRFMENLQTEVLHIEFNEFSKGLPIISELDFAKILLRYTMLHSDEYEAYLDRLSQRLQRRQGVSFEEFKAFCQFLNNLEDFGIAMRMYTLADRSIAPAVNKIQEEVRTHAKEFNRAVKICTGHSLSDHLVQTVFDIFDEDDDGQLSYKEFIAIMRNRLHRGIHPHSNKNEGWDAFKSCIKEEMRSGN